MPALEIAWDSLMGMCIRCVHKLNESVILCEAVLCTDKGKTVVLKDHKASGTTEPLVK